MKRSDRHFRALTTLNDLQVLKTANTTGGWRTRLEFYAERGWPTGGSTGNTTNEINRPTERFALQPDTEPARMLKDLERYEQQAADAAKAIRAISLYVTEHAKYDGPEPRPCIVMACERQISMIGTDIARNGRCPRCDQHHRRYNAEWPNKPTTCRTPENPHQSTAPSE